MSDTEDIEFHSTRKVRESGSSIAVTIPPEVVERSGIEPGEEVLVGSVEDGPVTLTPWGEDDVRETLGIDE